MPLGCLPNYYRLLLPCRAVYSVSNMSLSKFSLRYCLLAIAVLLCSYSSAAYAQPVQTIGLHDAYATVRDADGLINWYTTAKGGTILSFQYKSFVSFRINHNKVYTNNDLPASLPVQAYPLPTGVISRRGPKSPAGIDTITMFWKGVDGVDIFQDVYAIPVADGTTNPRCQIAVRFRFANRGGGPIDVETQYLLDVAIANSDGAKTLTRHGYKRWARYGRGEQSEFYVPPFFINFENELPNAPSYDPGISGQGWFINEQFGIKPPFRVTIGHWPTLERISWGSPSPLPTTPADKTFDNSILWEWDGITVPAGDTVTGPSFTYGTGDFQTCNGKLFALLFVPRKLLYDKPLGRYIPNPFTLDAYIFNPEPATSASNVSLKLDVGQNLTIVGAPLPSKSQTVTPNPNSINPLEVTTYSWQIQAALNRPCTGPIFADMTLSAVSSLGPPSFIDVCSPTIELPCTEIDLLPPLVDNFVGSEPDLTQSFDVSDNRQDDKGLQKIDYLFTLGDPTKFDVQIGSFTACWDKKVPVLVRQLDSTKGACITFTFTDCAGNFTTREMCFMVHDTIPVEDSLPPVFNLLERVGSDDGTDCNALRDSIEVTEKRFRDEGLASLVLTPGIPPQNMRLVSGPITDTKRHTFSVEVIDRFQDGSISVTASDLKGHKDTTAYTYCTIPDKLAPRIGIKTVNNTWKITVVDSLHWDRLIDEILLTNQQNVSITPMPTKALTSGKSVFEFDVTVVDTTKNAGICIVATDLAGNRSAETCPTNNPPKDNLPPVIGIDPPASSSPWKVTVNINDIHYRNNDSVNGRVPYDTGIQEIWFSNNTGMSIGTPARTFSPTVAQVPLFEIYVIDTNDAVNETACVTIHARDSANNVTSYPFCYPIKGDTLAPVITGVGATYDDIDLIVTDEKLVDRGLRRIEMSSSDNFRPFGPVEVSGDKSYAVKLQIANNGKSAVGRLQAMDMWGSNATRPEIKQLHTSAVDVYMWVQPFEMKKSHLIQRSGEFMLPVMLSNNDDYTVDQKGISQYEFSFRITGDPEVTFVGVQTDNTSSLGWNVNPIISNGGRDVTIVGTAPAGQTMKSSDSNIVVKLILKGAESEFSKSALIEIVERNGRGVILNDGQQSTITGQGTATAILPAPQSSINGASVVVAGYCTPLATADSTLRGKTIAMGPISPNPVSSNARVNFALPKTAETNLKLFNAVGEAVRTLTEGAMEAGNYEQYFDISGLSSGTYYLRLESDGQVITRTVKISR